MQSTFKIRHLIRSQIDVKSWDDCISKASNGLIYAKSFFLDALADNWDALIVGDYEVVMPLPWRKKWGIHYVYQVPFLQRLGIYGADVDNATIDQFYKKAVSLFKFINYKTDSFITLEKKALTHCSNFIIPLHPSYTVLQEHFTTECRKNIRKAESRGCQIREEKSGKMIIDFFKNAYGNFYPDYTDEVFLKVEKLIEFGIHNRFCKIYSVLDSEDSVVFAAALFFDEKRIYYSIGAPNEKGRQMRAPYFFIDAILKQYSGHKLTFDFEGSDLPNVASFYTKFGPATETYHEVIINNLPLPLRWMKKK